MTPIQKAIAEIYNMISASTDDNIFGLYAASKVLTDLLPYERECIEAAWMAGSYQGGVTGGPDYYNETYGHGTSSTGDTNG